ncbi:hypothetical protein [Tenacibaculum sp. 47A_GOM-205m]|uniref:hypothetical protein n=1 Tax=Tenacibaculum sp. 47A_GOM-205m TaxID=1380384 RepID=UPI00048E110E|nr:hypothetical protein [Tenacibaculum sp. 47A_GOM-205m]
MATFNETINTGTTPGDGQGDGLRTNMRKLIENDNFLKQEIENIENKILNISSGEGGKKFENLSQMQAITPVPSDYTVAEVTVNGEQEYHIWLSSEPNGTKFYKKIESVQAVYDDLKNKADLIIGKNLFDKNSVTEGYAINLTNGELVVSATRYVSDFIPVTEIDYVSSHTMYQIAYYDSSKVFISANDGSATTILTVPNGASFARITIHSSVNKDVFQLEQNTVSTRYEAYKKTIRSEQINLDGEIKRNNDKPLSGGKVYPMSKYLSSSDNMINSGDFPFYDYPLYNVVYGDALMNNGDNGLDLIITGDTQIATGKVFDNTVKKITLKGVCEANNTTYFGIGLKNGSYWGGMMYRGSNGARSMLQYASSSFVTGASISSSEVFNIGDEVIVEIQFIGGASYVRTAVNGIFSALTRMSEEFNNVDVGGEVHICFRGSTEWSNLTLNVQKSSNNELSKTYYVSKNGSDTNSGASSNDAFLTITKAVSESNGINEIIVEEGDYYNETFNLSTGVNITAKIGHKVRIIDGLHITSASLESGYTKVYSVAHSDTLTSSMWLWQHDVNDEATSVAVIDSHPLHRGLTHRLQSTKCTWKNSLAELESSDSSRSYFYWNAGTLYFTLVADSDLTQNPIVIPQNKIYGNGSNGVKVYLNNINFLYSSVNLSNTLFDVSDCSVMYSTYFYGWQYGSCVGGTFKRCRAGGINYNAGSGGDGFNGTNSAPSSLHANITSISSFDCWAHDNYDDGDSLHQYANCSIYGGLYEFNGSAITAASGGNMSVYNAIIRNNDAGLGAQGSPPNGYLNTSIQANSCLFENNTIQNTNSTGDDTIILINCVSVGNPFATIGVKLYNCTEIQ